MASWLGAERKSRPLKELAVGDLYDQLRPFQHEIVEKVMVRMARR
jgi:hypothetical protein